MARRFDDCQCHIQDYADFLAAQGKSATTIHTYLAGVCYAWDVPMTDIRKPIRHAAEAKRSRGVKKSDARKDTHREASPWLYDLGLRRQELLRLRRDCLVRDESGYLCVLVEKGLGAVHPQELLRKNRGRLTRAVHNGAMMDWLNVAPGWDEAVPLGELWVMARHEN